MKYVRRGTPPTPIPSGKAHSIVTPHGTITPRKPTDAEIARAVQGFDAPAPQPRDDADQLVHETATEAIQRRIDAAIEHIVTPEPDKPRKQAVKPAKAEKKPAVVTKSRARPKSPAKKK